jgi:hypothetical protein
MSEITDFLNAQYDKREAIAQRSASLQLDPENGWGIDGRAITPHIGVIHEDDPREHVALNNPAFVLADIESKRQVVELHQPDIKLPNDWYGNDAKCKECGQLWHLIRGSSQPSIPRGCRTLRLHAAPFAGEPGYKKEWAV